MDRLARSVRDLADLVDELTARALTDTDIAQARQRLAAGVP
ncbi:hypothetical protein HPC72_03555 [Actinomyces marmotae]|uniref:Uncharacterized protein n=1 Tax=Actinomyces marmotae TaxID=2737173 RepID=A0A6M8B953_9ACTO|nr:hypothetical protein HPC72_03555 [Actinomyces marmotae]